MSIGQNFTVRIMIVDGYRGNINCLSRHLAGLVVPPQIIAATDPQTAITRLETESFDLVIIDTCLSGKMDGFDLCRALRLSTPTQPLPIILILSGCLSLERSKGIAVGADLLIHKPIVKEELLKMVQLLLGSKLEQAQSSHPTESASAVPVRKLHLVS